MNEHEKLYKYLESVLSIAKKSTQSIFKILPQKKETALVDYQAKEKVVNKNTNNDRMYPVDNLLLEEFNNKTDLSVERAVIHTGAYADELTRSLHTLALTVGSDIYFRNKAYKPETEEGRKTLAHELTHVHQHTRNILKGEVTKKDLEKEAERAEIKFEYQPEKMRTVYQPEKMRTVRIGDDVYKLTEQEYNKFLYDLKNMVEEDLESNLAEIDEKEALKLLYTYKEMQENQEFLWQQ